ncbi:MAG: thiamine pyrophosphate-binding protein [Spirochaetota bacterium]|nr:thiamine pyrophosphate-binding protein [Spirochaetota bacterium]
MAGKEGRFKVLEQLVEDDIKYIFGNPGTVEQGFIDAISNYPRLKYINTLHESVAIAMADAYSRYTKKPSVVQLHSGVGLGNGIGMIYQAMRGHSPIVILAGEAGIKYDAMDSQMAVDLVSMAKPVTKWACRVLDSLSLLRIIRRAIKMASTPPMGPVFVVLPMDILDQINDEKIVASTCLITETTPSDDELNRIADIFIKSEKPMIIMGDGISFSKAQNELTKVAELTGAEIWGADSSEVNVKASHPLFKGLLGHMFGEHSQEIISKADAVLICGTYILPEVFPSFDNVFNTNAKIIHIDLNAYEIAKNFPVDIGIVSDPKHTLGRLVNSLSQRMDSNQKAKAQKRIDNLKEIKRLNDEKQLLNDKNNLNENGLNLPLFMETLARHINLENTVIFDEALTCSPELNRYIPAEIPGHFFQTRGGSLGVGIPGAIGLKLAAPNKTVIGFTGDGGSMYTFQALWTAAHYNIDAKFVVCNNKSYRLLKLNILQYWKERNITKHPYPEAFNICEPDIQFTELARALGVPAIRIEHANDIENAIKEALNTKGPFLIDLIVSCKDQIEQTKCKCGQ